MPKEWSAGDHGMTIFQIQGEGKATTTTRLEVDIHTARKAASAEV